MLEHYSHMHGGIRDLGHEKPSNDEVCTLSEIKRIDHACDTEVVMDRHIEVKQVEPRHGQKVVTEVAAGDHEDAVLTLLGVRAAIILKRYQEVQAHH